LYYPFVCSYIDKGKNHKYGLQRAKDTIVFEEEKFGWSKEA